MINDIEALLHWIQIGFSCTIYMIWFVVKYALLVVQYDKVTYNLNKK